MASLECRMRFCPCSSLLYLRAVSAGQRTTASKVDRSFKPKTSTGGYGSDCRFTQHCERRVSAALPAFSSG